MKKIPSLFIRDWENNPSLVTRKINLDCQWVIEGEGVPTRKWDGTCCMVRDSKLYKRYDAKFNKKKGIWKAKPKGFEPCQEPDEITGHQPGWIPVDFDKKEDKWFKMAWEFAIDKIETNSNDFNRFYDDYPNPIEEDGTYELCGIIINGNPDKLNGLYFIKHGYDYLMIYGFVLKEELYDSIERFLKERNIEGIVWHHPDGRMSKIKRTDFGLEWPIKMQLLE